MDIGVVWSLGREFFEQRASISVALHIQKEVRQSGGCVRIVGLQLQKISKSLNGLRTAAVLQKDTREHLVPPWIGRVERNSFAQRNYGSIKVGIQARCAQEQPGVRPLRVELKRLFQ